MKRKEARFRKVFVCSPLRPTHEFSFADNVELAKRLCLAACRANCAPFAPHIFYTQFLDENTPEDRTLGMACGMTWLGMADEMWVYAESFDHCSPGMVAEIEQALRFSSPPLIRYMPTEWKDVQRRLPKSVTSRLPSLGVWLGGPPPVEETQETIDTLERPYGGSYDEPEL